MHNTLGEYTGLRLPELSLLIMYWLMVNLGIGLNASLWVYRDMKDVLTGWVIDLHMILTIAGLVIYVFFGSGMILWSYKYQYFMFLSERRLRVMVGVGLCFFVRDLPCWFMELLIWWDHGLFHPLQSISFAMTSITFLIGLVAIWLEYAWRMSKVMDRRYGSESHIFTGRGVGGGAGFPVGGGTPGVATPFNPLERFNDKPNTKVRPGGLGHLDQPLMS